MIATGYYEFGFGQLRHQRIKSLDHKFQTLVRSPLSKSQNPVGRSSTTREVGEFRTPGQQSVRTEMDVVPAVLIIENLAIAGHKYGDRIGKKQHPGGHRTSEAVKTLVAHSGVLEFDGIHEMVQGHVSVSPPQTCEKGRQEAAEGYERISPESAEQQIEPNDIRL
jgi:hypothetical protein